MGRRESAFVDLYKILSQLANGGHLNYSLAERAEALARKMRKISIITIIVTSIVSTSYVYQALYPLVIGGSSGARLGLLEALPLMPFQVFIVALAMAFLYVAATEYLFAAHLSQSIVEARAREKTLQYEMVTQDLV